MDLGGTQLRAALFTSSGAMTARWSVPTPGTGGSERVIEEVFRQVTAAIHRAAVPPRAIGVRCLGHIDQDTGSILYAPRLPGLTRLPLGALLSERFALPVSVMNDANAAALAEWRLGAGRGAGNFCFVTVSTGVGCGLIINGRVLSGTVFWAPLREAVTASLRLDQVEPPPITPATLSDDAGLYGAVLGLLGNYQQ